ncbi:MAG: GxxExxY protein [Wenzhouxiangellaceae bacterium]|nr:GxxExxY protein [Wenzhouxiangellaceae bacterium]MBS3747205.1 GxxExxY protein [Wenzhouxiangellaceae bacterium]MBS3823383.1 GxxExxY protein [Wenzhouxiangellaceae bacterium]
MNANGRTVSECVIGCAIAVSNALGAGFLEGVYANALELELRDAGIPLERECPLPVFYRGTQVGTFKADFLIDARLVLELKAVRAVLPEHQAQLMNYLKAGAFQAGLLLNFGTPRLGVKRMVIDHDDDVPI